ncbi:MAG: hypothetical protein Q4F84_05555 [Fibrobacter sp.]|nr:hypothetical protein [Fibrobacter sp.]
MNERTQEILGYVEEMLYFAAEEMGISVEEFCNFSMPFEEMMERMERAKDKWELSKIQEFYEKGKEQQ